MRFRQREAAAVIIQRHRAVESMRQIVHHLASGQAGDIRRQQFSGMSVHQSGHANADFALLYVIAHQAGHAQAAQQAHLQALSDRLTAQVHERGGDAVRADAGLLEAFATGMMEIEARATLVGWNHTLDAWLHHKGIACGPQENPDVSVQQVMAQTELLQQVPHARPLELAIGLDNGKALQMEAHGIALSEHNIAAVVTALRRMPQALDID